MENAPLAGEQGGGSGHTGHGRPGPPGGSPGVDHGVVAGDTRRHAADTGNNPMITEGAAGRAYTPDMRAWGRRYTAQVTARQTT